MRSKSSSDGSRKRRSDESGALPAARRERVSSSEGREDDVETAVVSGVLEEVCCGVLAPVQAATERVAESSKRDLIMRTRHTVAEKPAKARHWD